MSSPLSTVINDNASAVTCGLAGIVVAILAIRLAQPSKLDVFPSVGSSGWFSYWQAAFKYRTNGFSLVQEGYKKHKSAPFKVATLEGWAVILGSREHADEVQRAPFSELSRYDSMQMRYTLGAEIVENPYHVLLVRSRLNRNLDALYPTMRNAIIGSFDDVLDLKGNEWKSIPLLRSLQKIICRTTNRVIVGDPLCYDPEWIDLNIQQTINVAKAAFIIRPFPKFLKPWALRYLTNVQKGQEQGEKLIRPIVEERRKYLNEYGNKWADKPNDYLSWLMDEVKDSLSTLDFLTKSLLSINFASIHTTSSSLAHALFYLAANPQYIQPLREEVEGIVDKEGWSKASLSKMRKVDSFLRECQRLEGITSLSVSRVAVKDFTFSDGMFIPQGTRIGVATHCLQNDNKYYENAEAFEPFRFVEMQEGDSERGKNQFASTSIEYQPFGHGRHACPGRFFASNEMKTMLGHVVTEYDIRLEDGTPRPRSLYAGTGILPSRAHVLFRKRAK